MKISVITVCYNSAKTIQDTLDSVASQTYTNLEYIIVDGLSKDNTMSIVDKSLPKLPANTIIISEKDRGIYDAMNKGLKQASGDAVGFLNSDDVFAEPNAVANIAETFKTEIVDIVYGNIVYTKQDDLNHITRTWRTGVPPKHGMRHGWHPPHPAFYVKRSAIDQVGGFNLSYPIAADYEMMVRMIEKHRLKTAWCDHTTVRMREGGTSNAGPSAIYKANLECLRAWKDNQLSPSPLLIAGKLGSKLLQYIATINHNDRGH
jgi:glycosyltransferase involved in cell wall biosynthesis